MPTRTNEERARSRAEARRRARLAARGELTETDDEEADPAPAPEPRGGGFLTRLFPPAPPLPNLSGLRLAFTTSGRFENVFT